MGTWSNTPIDVRFRTVEGLSIGFAESDARENHAFVLSPWPQSLLVFKPTCARPAEHAHLVAIDRPGFGHSQRSDALDLRGRWALSLCASTKRS